MHRHEPPVTSQPVKILYHDIEREFIVVDKPGSIVRSLPPLSQTSSTLNRFVLIQPVHASGRYYKNTLIEILVDGFGFEKVYRMSPPLLGSLGSLIERRPIF